MGQDETKKAKGRGNGLMLFLMIAILLLLVAQGSFLFTRYLAEESGDERPLLGEAAPAELTDEEIEARGWISAETLKRYAEEYNINTEFLSRI
ncbi:MAG: hypothetical protein LBP30_07025, partial [Clostridiales Family XIII bacterium]|nr:hypothetical protein [Clostridiales Family XIII bacterium]